MKLNIIFIFVFFSACSQAQKDTSFPDVPPASGGEEIATFAGGCFWCTEAVFERVEGVSGVLSGYSGGEKPNPTYQEVSMGNTQHAEAIQVYYDPTVVSFETLLEVFFLGAHDPTQVNRQEPDIGPQYRSIAFYRNVDERKAIYRKIEELEDNHFEEPVATQVKPFKEFYPAENYHQDYYPAHPNDPYIIQVSRPKIIKFEKEFYDILKDSYQ